MTPKTLADALAELATVPPKAFARARDALARQLRQAGQTKMAALVKARRVPTLPVWIVNRLALEERDAVEALMTAAESVKAAQIGRGGGPNGLTRATAAHRVALDRLLARAGAMLQETGAVPTRPVLGRVQTTLTAAAADATTGAALREGRLERELTARGFDVFEGVRIAAPRVGRAPRDLAPSRPATQVTGVPTRVAPHASKDEARQRQREAEREQRRDRIAQAQAALAEAQGKASGAQEQAASAKGRLTELLEQVEQARKALEERAAEARRMAQAVSQAARALRAAERVGKSR